MPAPNPMRDITDNANRLLETPAPPYCLVFAPGSLVWLLADDTQLDATVLELNIERGPCISYKVSWWAGNDRKEAWVKEFELQSKTAMDGNKPVFTSQTRVIGFK